VLIDTKEIPRLAIGPGQSPVSTLLKGNGSRDNLIQSAKEMAGDWTVGHLALKGKNDNSLS
jgi:hypothetical protein